MTERALNRLAALSASAVQTIGDLMLHSTSDYIKLSACGMVLDRLTKLSDLSILQDRVLALEEELRKLSPKRTVA